MKCEKCNNELFKIIQCDCEGCESNGAYDDQEEEYIYEEETIKTKKLERTEAFDEGNCSFGQTYGVGCYILECSECHYQTNITIIYE